MDDTAQPVTAAETDPFASAAEAFKVSLGQAPERPRDEHGRFTSTQAPEEAAEEEEEINADEGEPEAAESAEDTDEGEDAAEEAQQSAVDMPSSWSKDDAEIWSALPPEAQAKIAEREGQRDAAINQKFQEAANLRKAHEAEISEAQANRTKYAEAIDQVLSLIKPQQPPLSMLDINSGDYDPDQYHLLNAQYQQHTQLIDSLSHQRQEIAAQEQAEAERALQARTDELNRLTGPAFLQDYPDAGSEEKANEFLTGLAQYWLKAGVPAEYFQSGPIAAVEWHIMADARRWREHQQAMAKVKSDPKPAPKKPQPAVRPGVTTPKSAIEQRNRKQAFDRLDREGSVEAGAAFFRNIKW
jgi:hypothetical protein